MSVVNLGSGLVGVVHDCLGCGKPAPLSQRGLCESCELDEIIAITLNEDDEILPPGVSLVVRMDALDFETCEICGTPLVYVDDIVCPKCTGLSVI